jgi:hypothetical protein
MVAATWAFDTVHQTLIYIQRASSYLNSNTSMMTEWPLPCPIQYISTVLAILATSFICTVSQSESGLARSNYSIGMLMLALRTSPVSESLV